MPFGSFSPELRLHIASFLDRSDAVSLACAHSTWQDAAESVIWREVDVSSVDVPEIWWARHQNDKLDSALRKCYIRLSNAIFLHPVRGTMIRKLTFVCLNDIAGLVVELIRRSSGNLQSMIMIPLDINSYDLDDADIHRIYEQLSTIPPCLSLTCANLYLSSRWHLEVPIVLRFAPRLSELEVDGDSFGDVNLHSTEWPLMPSMRMIRVGLLVDSTQEIIDKMLSVAPGMNEVVCLSGPQEEIDFHAMARHPGLNTLQLRVEPGVIDGIVRRLSHSLADSASAITSIRAPFTVSSLSASLYDVADDQEPSQPFIFAPNLSTVIWLPPSKYDNLPSPPTPLLRYKTDLSAAQSGSPIQWLPKLQNVPELRRIEISRCEPQPEGRLDIMRHRAETATVFVLNLWELLGNGQWYKVAGVVMYDGVCVPNETWRRVVELAGLDEGASESSGQGKPLSAAASTLLRGETFK